MRLFLLTTLTMIAFAANSVLNRAAVQAGDADPAGFAVLRVAAGALVLALLLRARGGTFDLAAPRRWLGAGALAVYMIGFSLAYLGLDAGVGALILFGTVQITLFAQSAVFGTRPSPVQIAGTLVAFGGLMLALWPDPGASGSAVAAGCMVAAGLGWAAYTLAGRGARDPVAASAAHFVLCVPLVLLLVPFADLHLSAWGAVLAIASGALTSGLGYALWYAVLPGLPGARAAVVQLSVPVIALGLGAALLGEAVTVRAGLAAVLVLGGIALALRR